MRANKRFLYVVGCSWSAKGGNPYLNYDGESREEKIESEDKLKWQRILSDKLNLELINDAVVGVGSPQWEIILAHVCPAKGASSLLRDRWHAAVSLTIHWLLNFFLPMECSNQLKNMMINMIIKMAINQS